MVSSGGVDVGWVAELHPAAALAAEAPQGTALFEVDVDALLSVDAVERRANPVPRFPAALRDLAVVVPEAIAAASVEAVIRRASPHVEAVRFQSVYRGAGVPDGAKCLAWSVTMRAEDRTLTDAEVRDTEQSIWSALTADVSGQQR